jgi:drug/metabolite transporter, DME family
MKGAWYALFAAILNAFVGVFSIGAFNAGISAGGVAFYKCVFAFCLLSCWVLFDPKQRKACIKLLPHAHKIALIAFCGIFLLYFFETRAYQYNAISAVAFTVLGTSTIATFVGSQIILKKSHSMLSWLSMLLAMIGLAIFHFSTGTSHLNFALDLGFVFAMIAGLGYGLFLVLNKKNPDNFHGIAMLWWLLLFGSLFLLIPYILSGPEIPSLHSWTYIALLGGASTIGGFYCTTKALSLATATTVQLFELNEPLFATLLGLLFYQQWPTLAEMLGGLLILTAIVISSKAEKAKKNVFLLSVLGEKNAQQT